MFICFVGIDGSGKTLQAEMLVRRLQEEGLRCGYVWCRYSPRVLMPLIRLAKRLIRRKKKGTEYEEFTSAKQGIFRKPILGRFWLNFSLLEYLVQITWTVRRRLWGGGCLVCDRYIYDMLADMAVNLDCADHRVSKLAGHPLIRMFPTPDLVFFLDVPPAVAYRRKRDPNVMGEQYLVDRAKIYSHLSNELGFTRVDGTKSIEEIADNILREALGHIKRAGCRSGK